ncbi:MAG: phosphatidate cytidylyltransferase [Thalassobium sp.]|uniref:phosphatidate cytidylyltransferase n=1 Tax=Octadecabacter sp. SW4 TaxID=2602067 RepID=UPI000C0F55EB|nr:phosphatidate cytidylyltransferase [Octadecabacter sp. SW4]PHQ81176.1 MAG: phosphatidate cytidylyltransferase [Thalassobium sp.]QEE34868.1 phosphatidate cytidylyltransferase [Octadecabacter sp. SW4]|tara:strand:- start:913 stop:1860 length:948 start_codon:yes stop_codon:yes gene_type:complete
MSNTTSDILLLFLGVAGILMALTLFGEILRAKVAPDGSNPVVETFMTRVHSWWAMVILLSLALLIGRIGIVVLFAFASFAALRELMTMTSKSQADHMSLAVAFYIILPVQYVLIWLGWSGMFMVFIPVYAFLLLPIVSALRGDANRFLVRVAETQWGLMIAVFCASNVPALMTIQIEGYPHERALLLIAFLVLVVQFGDLLDFFFGRRIGRTKIAAGISPKTYEGVICGVGSAMLIGALLAWITPFGIIGAMAMAGVASLVGMFGNIVFAAIKRDRGIKDWSHLIPGQGGVADQLDSVVFAAPIFYQLTLYFWGA